MVKNNFDFDTAFSLGMVERSAFCIILRELELSAKHDINAKYNFNLQKFESQSP